MGTEYRFAIVGPIDPIDVDRVLRAHPRFSDFDPAYGSYNFRFHGAPPSMPHAEARIEQSAIYFCDYADDGTIFQVLRAALSSRYRLTVQDVE